MAPMLMAVALVTGPVGGADSVRPHGRIHRGRRAGRLTLAPRTPVLVGAGTATQRFDDPFEGLGALGLMQRALEAAAVDAGPTATALLDRVDEVIVPEGLWRLADPGRSVLDGRSPEARSIVAKVGVLQQTLMSRSAQAIADGRSDVVVLCGGEAKWRALRAAVTGVTVPEPDGATGGPDETLTAPFDEIMPEAERERGLVLPTHQYAVMESAVRHAAHRTPADHERRVAELVAGMSRVAAANPSAWNRRAVTADDVLNAPRVADPYTKPACSQWNVDQAAAFLLTSAETAEAAGIGRDRWIFPLAGVESNHIVSLSQRADLHRSPAVGELGRVLVDVAGRPLAEVELLELYSCFPSAVQIQAAEYGIGLDPSRAPTVTGGMHFGGGPFNSFTFQALARLVDLLRAEPSATALLTSVSGLMTKVGAGLWSATPPKVPFASTDVSAAAAAATSTKPLDPDAEGTVTIAGYTVGHGKLGAIDAVVIADTLTGTRAVARTDDADLVAALQDGEWCGRTVTVRGAALVALD